jgi:hypothetical protein
VRYNDVARALVQRFKYIMLHDGIKRVRAMPQQVGLSRTKRAGNI